MGLLSSAVRVQQDAVDVGSGNIARANSEGVHRQNPVQQVSLSYDGRVKGLKSTVERVANPLMESQVRDAFSEQQRTSTLALYTSRVDGLISLEKDGVAEMTMSLIAKAKAFHDSPGDHAHQQQFVSASVSLTKSVRELASKINQMTFEAEKDIHEQTVQLNQKLKELFLVNDKIFIAENPQNILDERDVLLTDLAAIVDIRVRFDEKGRAIVDTQAGVSLVSEQSYSKVKFNPAKNTEDLVDTSMPMDQLRVAVISREGTEIDISADLSIKGHEAIKSGKLKGLVELRRDILPNVMDNLDSVARGITRQVNEIYSSGSGVPPSSTLTAMEKHKGEDISGWEGKVKIAVLDDKGRAATVSNNGVDTPLRPLELDLSEIYGEGGVGKLALSDIVKVVNAKLQGDMSKDRLTLPGLDNIVMEGISDVKANGVFDFRMQLDNASPFATKFNILDVQVFDQANNVVNGALLTGLPDTHEVAAGSNDSMHNGMRVQLPVGVAHATIAIRMQTYSADGSLGEGWATFQINDPAVGYDTRNQHFYGVKASTAPGVIPASLPALPAGGVDGNILVKAPYANGAVMSAKMVDDEGFTVSSNSESAKLSFQAAPGLSVVVDSMDSKELGDFDRSATCKGFAHYFGFNPLFEEHKVNQAYHMKVRDDIVANPSKLSFAKLAEVPKQDQYVVKGLTAATASLDLAGNNPGAGNTIAINGAQYTFAVAPANNENQILEGTTPQDTAQNIVAKLNLDNAYNKRIHDVVSFSIDPANPARVVATAKHAGSAGNNIATLEGGGMAATWNNTTLTGGSDTYSNFTLDAQPGVGNQIVINGVNFTYGGAGIAIGGDLSTTIQNTVAAINANAGTSALVVASVDYADPHRLILRPKSGAAAAVVALTTTVVAASGRWDNAALQNVEVKAERVTNFTDHIGSGNRMVMKEIEGLMNNAKEFSPTSAIGGSTMTLVGYISNAMSIIAGHTSSAKTEDAIASRVVAQMTEDVQKLYMPDKDQEYMAVMDASQLVQSIYALMGLRKENNQALIRAMG